MTTAPVPGGRFAVVGSGSAARRHRAAVAALLPEVEVVEVRRDPGATDPWAAIDALAEDPPAMAVVATPAPTHVALAQRLRRLGCHVLVEKPVADEPGAAAALVDDFRDAGLVLAVGYQLRHGAPLLALGELLAEPRCGTLVHVSAVAGQWLPEWRPAVDYRTTVSARRELGGGALLELSHELDYVRWLLGPATVRGAVARSSGALDIDVEDLADVLLDGSGATANVRLDLLRSPVVRECRALTTEGEAVVDLVGGGVTWRRHGEPVATTVLAPSATWLAEASSALLADFVRCATTGGTPVVDGAQGLATLELVAAARAMAAAPVAQ